MNDCDGRLRMKRNQFALMKNPGICLKLAAIGLVATGFARGAEMAEVMVPEGPLNLLEQPREFFRFHVDEAKTDGPAQSAEEIFQMDGKGHLHISGKTWGYVRTAKRFRDYHVSLEYRFKGPTYEPRKDKARDSGLLVHCFGKDGGFKKTWISSIEAQIMEGTTGDFIVLGPFNDDGEVTPVHLESTGTKLKGQQIPFYDPEGEKVMMPENRPLSNALASKFRHADWKQTTGIQFESDADYPTGEKWNKLEVTCDGDEITVMVNGKVANKGWHASPTLGFLAIQSEGAEVEFRNWILTPLKDEEE